MIQHSPLRTARRARQPVIDVSDHLEATLALGANAMELHPLRHPAAHFISAPRDAFDLQLADAPMSCGQFFFEATLTQLPQIDIH